MRSASQSGALIPWIGEPPTLLSTVVIEDVEVTRTLNPMGPVFGVISSRGIIRRAIPKHVYEQLITWTLIQKERKRLGLPLLTSGEMEVRI